MKISVIPLLLTAFLSISALTGASAADSVNSLKIDNIGMGSRMIRLGKAGIILDNAGFCLEGKVSVTVEGQRGQRLMCILHPVRNGSFLRDRKGDLMSVLTFEPESDNYTCSLPVEIPYSWLGIDMMSNKQTVKDVTIDVMIVALDKNSTLASKVITLGGDDIKIDRDQLPNHLLGSLFGGDSVDGDFITKCSACDGTGICSKCDGDGFFDPSICRKCAEDPGICRRCNGLGKEGTEVDGGGSLFDLFF